MSVAKNHHQIIVRAADAAEKFEWLARLRNAADARGGVGRAPPISTTTQQLQQGQGGPAPRRASTGGTTTVQQPQEPERPKVRGSGAEGGRQRP
jgi:dynamin GTPase